MGVKTECYTINKHYKADKQKMKKAFEILLNSKAIDNLKEEKKN